MGVLLSVGGELWVPPADQSLEHARRDPLLLVLEKRKPGGHADWLHTTVAVSEQVTK